MNQGFFEYMGDKKADCGHYDQRPKQISGRTYCNKCARLVFGANSDIPTKGAAHRDEAADQTSAQQMARAEQRSKDAEMSKAREAKAREDFAKAHQQNGQGQGNGDEGKGANGDAGDQQGQDGDQGQASQDQSSKAKGQQSKKNQDGEDKAVMHSEFDPWADKIAKDVKTIGERMDNGQKEIELAKAAFDSHTAQIQSLESSLVTHLSMHEADTIALIKKHAKAGGARVIKLKVGEEKARELPGTHHCQFALLLKTCTARLPSGDHLNVWLKGPAGTGKTTAAVNVAQVLNMPFAFNGALDSEYKLKGFIDATGKVISSPFRRIWENGGIYLFDEVDASLPNAVLAFNAALANGSCDFPDANVKRHPDCIVIAAANTFGNGATAEYVGRAKQDAAFLDRFVQIDWIIDEELERTLCPSSAWVEYVQTARARVKERGLKGVIVSPRASLFGASLLEAGIDPQAVIGMTVRKGMTDDQWKELALPVFKLPVTTEAAS